MKFKASIGRLKKIWRIWSIKISKSLIQDLYTWLWFPMEESIILWALLRKKMMFRWLLIVCSPRISSNKPLNILKLLLLMKWVWLKNNNRAKTKKNKRKRKRRKRKRKIKKMNSKNNQLNIKFLRLYIAILFFF